MTFQPGAPLDPSQVEDVRGQHGWVDAAWPSAAAAA